MPTFDCQTQGKAGETETETNRAVFMSCEKKFTENARTLPPPTFFRQEGEFKPWQASFNAKRWNESG